MAKASWHKYDKSSKWLIEHHGDAILWLAGVRGVETCKALHAEVVQPQQLPDGILEVTLTGQEEKALFVVELATFPEARLLEQVSRDLALVYLDRGVVPEVVSVVLHPKGAYRVSGSLDLCSRQGLTRWQVNWRVVELWTVPAADLLAANDVGLIPWVPLAAPGDDPRAVLQECRTRIDRQAPEHEREQLLAVTTVLATLRYNDPGLLSILGGKSAMLEFPIIQEIVVEIRQKDILRVLLTRLGSVPRDLEQAVRSVQEEEKLDKLFGLAASCQDLDTFRKGLQGD
jgi:hypothetical protein